MRRLFLAICFVFASGLTQAQSYVEISIGGTQTLCSDSITDSDSNGSYLPNENYTITICPDENIGSKVKVTFPDWIDIHESDTLYVYDGTDPNNDPLLLKYNNTNANISFALQASFENNSGCLTFVFISDNADEGLGWAAGISCERPCQTILPSISSTTPNASTNDNSGIINLCLGDTVEFDATASYPQSDYGSPWYSQSNSLSIFKWYFGDGDSLVGTNLVSVTHPYSQSHNAFLTKLVVVDQFGCQSTAFASRKVQVSTLPTFSPLTILDDTICFGQSLEVVGGVIPTTGSLVTGSINTDSIALLDGIGVDYLATITIESFNPGQTITSADDLSEICIDIEHTSVTDLSFTLICPNGTQLTLLEYPNAAQTDHVFIGEPVDDYFNQVEVYGPTYTYCFNNNPEYGTFSDEVYNHTYSYTDVLGDTYIDKYYLPEGSYESYESINSLIGCPLNGVWTLKVTDNEDYDNGFISGWNIGFSPDILTDPGYYAPVFNPNAFAWGDSDITGINGDTATITPSSGNLKNYYTFYATDDFGCTYDTTFAVYTKNLNASILGDSLLCPVELLNLEASFENQFGALCPFSFGLHEDWGDGWNGASVSVEGVDFDPISFTVPSSTAYVEYSFSLPYGSVLNFNFNSGGFDDECAFELFDGEGNSLYKTGYQFNLPDPVDGVFYSTTITCPVDIEDYTYLWSPGALFNDSTIQSPYVVPTADTTFITLVVNDPASGCSDTAAIRLKKIAGFTNTLTLSDTLVCLNEAVNFTVSPDTAGTFTYDWSPALELISSGSPTNQSAFESGGYKTVTVEVESDWGCNNIDTFLVRVSEGIIPDISITGNVNVCYGDNNQLDAVFSNTPFCDFTLEGIDDYGDGWNASEVEITVNGTAINVLDMPNDPDDYEVLNFSVASGTEFSLNYVDGTSFDDEVFFNLYDDENTLLFAGDGMTEGVVYTTTASCMVMSTYTFEWNHPTTLSDATIQNPVSFAVSNLTYQVIVTDTIAFCADTATHSIVLFNQLDAGVPLAGPFCEYDAAVTLQANTSGGTWLGVGITNPSTGTFNPNIANPGIHQVKYTVSNAACTNDSIITITVYAQPNAPIPTVQNPYCKNSLISGASLSGIGDSYAWYSDRELTTLISNEQSPFELNQADAEKYIYFTQTKDGCVSNVDSVKITVVDVPVASISASPSSGFVPLEVVFTNNSTPTDGVTHVWSDNINPTSSASAPTFVYEVYGEYTVVYTITDSLGCSDSDTLKITAEDVSEVLIPNVFTPNSTIGENDEFRVEGKNLANFRGIIYNRWGLKVYEWSDSEGGWSGERNPDGVYYYVITYTDIKGEDHKVAGHVTMIGSGN